MTKGDEVVYSPPLIANGLVWRLKVYPFGNGGAKGEFISVFLELVDGLFVISKYFYKIELCNWIKNDKKYSNYVQDFTNGECWEYIRFYIKLKIWKERDLLIRITMINLN